MEQMKITEMEALINRNYKNICGMNVLKNGVSVYEAYFQGCTSESRMHVYSVTKSIVSILLGIAMDEGTLRMCRKGFWIFFRSMQPGRKSMQRVK